LPRLQALFEPIIIGGQMPPGVLASMVTSLEPLLLSIASPWATAFAPHPRGDRVWSAALGAAMQPISRTFDPQFTAILKAGAPQQ
jgi:hypothetical protein